MSKKKTLEELLTAQTEAQTAVNNAQMKLNAIKTQVSEETYRLRNNRLRTRGEHLEKYLEDPELFTNEDICKLIDCVFSLATIHTFVGDMLKVRRGEANGSVDELIKTAAAKLKRPSGMTPQKRLFFLKKTWNEAFFCCANESDRTVPLTHLRIHKLYAINVTRCQYR